MREKHRSGKKGRGTNVNRKRPGGTLPERTGQGDLLGRSFHINLTKKTSSEEE